MIVHPRVDTQTDAFSKGPRADRADLGDAPDDPGSCATSLARFEAFVQTGPSASGHSRDPALDELVSRCLAQLRKVMDGLQ